MHGQRAGVIASYVDDLAFHEDLQAAPSLDHNAEALVTSRLELSDTEEDLERDNRALPQKVPQ